MSTSNSRIQGILAGLAGPADFGNLLSIPLAIRMRTLYQERLLHGCALQEVIIMFLSVHHVLSFYMPFFFYWKLYANAMWLIVTAAINQVLCVGFLVAATMTLRKTLDNPPTRQGDLENSSRALSDVSVRTLNNSNKDSPQFSSLKQNGHHQNGKSMEMEKI